MRSRRERRVRAPGVLLILMVSVVGGPRGQSPKPFEGVGVDQNLNARLPLELRFREEGGEEVRLGDFFRDRPVALAFVYFDCPMLCSYVLDGLVRALRPLPLRPGEDLEVVVVSFAPEETPAQAREQKQEVLDRYGRPGTAPGWHFLTGGEEAIRALTGAAGFRYRFDPESGEYAHAAVLAVATPEGRLARYLMGIEYSARDLRLALLEASEGRVGSAADRILLYCFQYDPETGRYSLMILRLLRLAAVATLVVLGAGLWWMSRRRKRRETEAP